jgi:hypothetical protein
LFINGERQVGLTITQQHVFVWPEVKLSPGDVHIAAIGTDINGHKHHDACTVKVA